MSEREERAKEYTRKLCENKVKNKEYDRDGHILYCAKDVENAYIAGENEKKDNFKKDLTDLLNNYGWNTACETPDNILADYIVSCLENYCATTAKNIAWHADWKRLGEESDGNR